MYIQWKYTRFAHSKIVDKDRITFTIADLMAIFENPNQEMLSKTPNYPNEITFLNLENLPSTIEKLCPVIVFKVLDKTAASIFHYCKLLGKDLSVNMGQKCPYVFMNRQVIPCSPIQHKGNSIEMANITMP